MLWTKLNLLFQKGRQLQGHYFIYLLLNEGKLPRNDKVELKFFDTALLLIVIINVFSFKSIP